MMSKRLICRAAIGLLLLSCAAAPAFACDTWVALPDATSSGKTILAKNSDRPLFDCQPLLFNPRQSWPEGSTIELGRVTIPQVSETYATLGSSPYWCWGYEEGINEFGVAIGNEGIRTKTLAENMAAAEAGDGPPVGPTGMDLLRLGLERGKTAREALEAMAGLISKYGQFGSGTPTVGIQGAYENSFIIADGREAWILETAGTEWVARKIEKGTASISNTVSIGTEYHRASPGLIERAVSKGWWPEDKAGEFDFSAAYGDDSPEALDRCLMAETRAMRSAELLEEKGSGIDVPWMMRIARDRGSSPSIDLDQTASSCVAVLPSSDDDIPVFWWCPAVPSTSCYVPFFVHGSSLPTIVSQAGTFGRKITAPSQVSPDGYAEDSYWWLFRDLSYMAKGGTKDRTPEIRKAFDVLEKEFAEGLPEVMERAAELRRSGRADEAAKVLDNYSAMCVEKAIGERNRMREQLAAEAREAAGSLDAYTGIYSALFMDCEVTVTEDDGSLTVSFPGRGDLKLKAPDGEGIWYFIMSDAVGFSFDTDSTGEISAMRLHQTTPLSKDDTPAAGGGEIPAELAVYLGGYRGPMGSDVLTVMVREGRLVIDNAGREIIQLDDPDEKGRRFFSHDRSAAVSFMVDDSGTATAMNLHRFFRMPKGRSAAMEVGKAINTEGIEKAVARYYELKLNKAGEYYISEREFNTLGYRLLAGNRTTEAVEIFKLNVEAFPLSWNAYDSMGEGYMKLGDRERAIAFYRKSLELNPDNESGRKILEELEQGD